MVNTVNTEGIQKAAERPACRQTSLQSLHTGQHSPKLTSARALLLYALFAYESMGEYSSLFAANKLSYFLQRMGQPLRLDFKPHHYGPYAIGVEKVLYSLNGVFLKGLEQGQAKPFEALKLDYTKFDEVEAYIKHKLSEQEAERIRQLIKFIDGFTSELSLEILATVAFILAEHPSLPLEGVMQKIKDWNIRSDHRYGDAQRGDAQRGDAQRGDAHRKKDLFKEEYVAIALDHLMDYKNEIFK